jgi:hypothetical protein
MAVDSSYGVAGAGIGGIIADGQTVRGRRRGIWRVTEFDYSKVTRVPIKYTISSLINLGVQIQSSHLVHPEVPNAISPNLTIINIPTTPKT